MARPVPHGSAPAFTLASQGRGIAQERIKGAFGWGSPLQFKSNSRHLWPAGQAGAGSGHQSPLRRRPVHAFVGFCLCLAVGRLLEKFLVSIPSLARPALGRGRQCSGEDQGEPGRAEAVLGSLTGRCSLDNFRGPFPAHHGQLGSSEGKPQTSFILPRLPLAPAGGGTVSS